MSLILEALKKSESERQRQSGPTLLEVRVANAPRRYPIWALAVAILLVANLVLLLVFVLHRPSAAPAEAARTAAPVTAPAATMAAVPAPAAASTPPAASGAPPALAPPPAVPAAVPARADTADRSPTLADVGAGENPADELPAVPKTSGSVRVQRDDSGGYSSLPSFSEVGGNMPDLRLDLHVYAERARDRYALINMQTVHEGDTLSEGARVLAITREGVALDYRGQQFMLRPQ